MLTITWNVDQVQRDVDNEAKQVRFALSRTLNFVAEKRRKEMINHVRSVLIIRSRQMRKELPGLFLFGEDDRSDQKLNRFVATIRVLGRNEDARSPVAKSLSAILLRQDDAGVQTSSALYRGQNNELIVGGFVIPAPGLRTATKSVSSALYPAAIGLKLRRSPEGNLVFARQSKGGKKKRGGFKKNTMFFFAKENTGIFVRKPGPGPSRYASSRRGSPDRTSTYQALWFFRRRITLPKRVDLAGTFAKGLDEQLATTYVRFYQQALETAR